MKRLVSTIRGDFKLQVRYGIYTVYAVVTLVYIGLLTIVPELYRGTALTLVVFSDPSFLGFFFIGGLVLLEKSERIPEYLSVTPMRTSEYLVSKMVSLTFLALVASFLISFLTLEQVNYFLLALGVLLTSFLFILIGFAAVARFSTVNGYILSALVYTSILSLPILDFFGIYRTWLFFLFPTYASLLLIGGAFGQIKMWEGLYSAAYLCLCIVLAYKWAFSSFERFMIRSEGR